MGEIAVIGAGVAGLTTAWALLQSGVDVRVFEAGDRVGGVIHTVHRDGWTFEQGPQLLRARSLALLALVDALDLRGAVREASAAVNRRYILWNGRLTALPSGPLGALVSPVVPVTALLRALTEPLRARGGVREETVHAFLARRVGGVLADRLADPLVAAVFGGDARATEVAAAFPEWTKAEEEHGSLALGLARRARAERADKPVWAPRSVFTLEGGLQVLVDHLASELGDRVQVRTPVTAVVARGRGWRVETADGTVDAEHVVVACPPRAAEGFLPGLDELPEMPAAAIASVHLGWRDGVDLDGLGWLAPSRERTDVLGAIWVTGVFPHQAPGAMVRVMLGGARDRERIEGDEQALVTHATRVVREVQGIDAPPDITHLTVNRSGMPQYPPGHSARVARLRGAHDTLHFVGWGYTGAAVPHCIEASLALADTLTGVTDR